jgi:hypothetical protein
MKKLSLLLVLLMNAEFGFSQSIRFSGGTSLYLPLNINNLKITQAPGAGFQLGSEIKFKYIGFETRAELFRSQIIVDDDPLVSSLNLYSHSINYYEFNLPISFKFYSPTIYERYSFNVCFGHIFRRLAWSNATLTPIFNTGGPIISGKPDFRIFNNSLLDNFFIGIGSEYQFKSIELGTLSILKILVLSVLQTIKLWSKDLKALQFLNFIRNFLMIIPV